MGSLVQAMILCASIALSVSYVGIIILDYLKKR